MTSAHVRVLGPGDLPAFVALCAQDPVVNVFAEHRARTTNLEPRWLGGEVLGKFVDGELVAGCHVAANLVPVQCTTEDAADFAAHTRTARRTVSTIVGPSPAVEAYWDVAEREWSKPREVRLGQPHLEISTEPLIEPDPEVRPSRRKDLETLYPACVAMYTEEVGISPEVGGGADLYRARVSQLIARGWSFARYEDGRVVFKAEVACATDSAAQVQGVYVAPDRRGEGLGARGMAAVVALVHERIAPTVSLYVNDFNTAARAAYERVGFEQTATFSTVMF